MARINLNTELNNVEEKEVTKCHTKGIKVENKISFLDNDIHVTILTSNNTIELKRENSSYALTLSFNSSLTTTGIYDIKCNGIKFYIKIKTNKLVIKENKISVAYELKIDNYFKPYTWDIEYEVA